MRNVILFGSIALNLFLGGLLVGGFLFQGEKDGRQAPPAYMAASGKHADEILPIRAFGLLEHEKRKFAREQIKKRLPETRALRREISQKHRVVADLLKQSSLDQDALQEAIRGLHEAQLAQKAQTSETMLLILAELSDEDRIMMMKHFEERREHKRQERRERKRHSSKGE